LILASSFMRLVLVPENARNNRPSPWRSKQCYLTGIKSKQRAHVALAVSLRRETSSLRCARAGVVRLILRRSSRQFRPRQAGPSFRSHPYG